LKQLERDREKQQGVMRNVESKLNHIESKVARGLGERSSEEKEQLMKRIFELEEERKENKQRNMKLEQQCKILNQEVKRMLKKNELCEINRNDIRSSMEAIELEIASCEVNLEKLSRNKEENTVTMDVVRLEVRRLRDMLNLRVNEVLDLEKSSKELCDKMNHTRRILNAEIESRRSRLRAVEDERHQCAVESGQRAVAAEKMKSKYEMIVKARNGCDHGDERGGTSQVNHLIEAAQRRAELQREGDKLDGAIRKKQQDILSMQKTLAHLKKRNTDFRHSFQKVDKDSDEYRQMLALQSEVETSEGKLLELKKTMQDLGRSMESLMTKLDNIRSNQAKVLNENNDLEDKISALEVEIKEKKEEGKALSAELQHER
jgi:chromosome segregation ATPase